MTSNLTKLRGTLLYQLMMFWMLENISRASNLSLVTCQPVWYNPSMNREIKFRVWDKETEVMKVLGGLYPYQDEQTVGGEVFYEGEKTSKYFPEECEVMQYVGLTDKNGREIYEGDIIQHHDHHGNIARGVVRWDERDAAFTPGVGLMSEASQWLEVVGTVYESPELLDDKV
jgi:hypothetical protein